MLTYRELAVLIASLTEEQKDQTVTVYSESSTEFSSVTSCEEVLASDVLDRGHNFLVIN